MNLFVIVLLVALGFCIYIFIGFMFEDFIDEHDDFLVWSWPILIAVAIIGLCFFVIPNMLYKEACTSYANYKFRKRIKKIIKKVAKKNKR